MVYEDKNKFNVNRPETELLDCAQTVLCSLFQTVLLDDEVFAGWSFGKDADVPLLPQAGVELILESIPLLHWLDWLGGELTRLEVREAQESDCVAEAHTPAAFKLIWLTADALSACSFSRRCRNLKNFYNFGLGYKFYIFYLL